MFDDYSIALAAEVSKFNCWNLRTLIRELWRRKPVSFLGLCGPMVYEPRFFFGREVLCFDFFVWIGNIGECFCAGRSYRPVEAGLRGGNITVLFRPVNSL